jgi:hypothetical protein
MQSAPESKMIAFPNDLEACSGVTGKATNSRETKLSNRQRLGIKEILELTHSLNNEYAPPILLQ